MKSEIKEMLKEVDIEKSSETPFSVEWESYGSPVIVDNKGNVIATIATGTFTQQYSYETIIANTKRLLYGNSKRDKRKN